MARPKKPRSEQQRMASFAKAELQVLVDRLGREADFETEAPDLLGALVLAASRLPAEVVRELMPAYVRRARQELDKEARP
jgi:hypothetical protein